LHNEISQHIDNTEYALSNAVLYRLLFTVGTRALIQPAIENPQSKIYMGGLPDMEYAAEMSNYSFQAFLCDYYLFSCINNLCGA
jgi:hypothetical protein